MKLLAWVTAALAAIATLQAPAQAAEIEGVRFAEAACEVRLSPSEAIHERKSWRFPSEQEALEHDNLSRSNPWFSGKSTDKISLSFAKMTKDTSPISLSDASLILQR